MKNFTNKKYIFIFLILILILIVGGIFIYIKQKSQIQTKTDTTYTFKGIVPGKTTKDELNNILGEPLRVDPKDNSTQISYKSDYDKAPHIAVVKGETLEVLIERVDFKKNLNIQEFKSKYGEPQVIYYTEFYGNSYPLHVFAKYGLAATAHQSSGLITEIWHFEPTNLTTFEKISPFPLNKEPIKEEESY